MNSTFVFRPLRDDERPWSERHAVWLSWITLAAILAWGVSLIPGYITHVLHGDLSYFIPLLMACLVGALMLYGGYSRPRWSAAQQAKQLVVTEQDISLKHPASGAVLWRMRRDEVGSIRTMAEGRYSRLILQRRTESKARRFMQWAGVQDGKSLMPFDWVNDARTDPQNRPGIKPGYYISTRKKLLADLWASDLGQALILSGYVPEQRKN